MATQDQPTTAEARQARARTPILLVDDQRFVGMALARLLDGEPLELHCCERGSEAEATADRIQPALILQDLVMPDVDGLTLVRAFQTRASTARTPIVVLSGNDDAVTRDKALAAGAVDYLVKLPTKDVLLACLDRHLSGGAASGAPAAAAARPQPAGDVVLDPEFLAAYRDEGAADPDETLRELFDVFFRDAERLMGDLRRAAAAGFNVAVPRVAHALKGCALAAGAPALAGVCAEMETGTLGAADGIARLEVELARVRTTLARPPGGRAIEHCSSEAEPEGPARGGASLA